MSYGHNQRTKVLNRLWRKHQRKAHAMREELYSLHPEWFNRKTWRY